MPTITGETSPDGRVDHHLVHQPDAAIDLAKPDECLADADLRQDEQVRIGEPLADLGGSFVRVQSRGRVADRHALHRCGDEQVPRLDPLAVSLGDESLRFGEPAGGRRHLASAEMLDGHPKGAANGPRDIAGTDRIPVRPARELHALRVFADEVRRDGEALEVLDAERCLTIGRRQEVAGIRPRLAVVRGPAAVQGGLWRSRALRHRSSFRHRREIWRAPPGQSRWGTRRPCS